MSAAAGFADEPARLRTGDLVEIHRGAVMDLVSQDVDLGPGGQVVREYLRHPGAVAIVALDEAGRMLLLRQYRHPVRSYLWEVPAGLLDQQGEDLVAAAARELAEEADLRAARWDTLVDFYTSPGGSDEAVRVFLARDLHPVPTRDRHQRVAEEAGMISRWVALEEAVDAVLAGRIHNPSTVAGALAAHVLAGRDWDGLRPADAAWVPRSGGL
ncbi:NUDIX domain-containing protein [Pseudactinotalea sp. Z1739]|uniref:NUDIX domain-containing protein n=1 Tax=Pseudactinotalea sp. Z1739 TaxID=3413028 RepID=UPI003C7EAD86